ncbi:MAG TPA: hypothetical protein VHD87_15480 [Acidimicrobiales bacterium]|nr:hypothetical protein [Acidimicrobiales bacterium]
MGELVAIRPVERAASNALAKMLELSCINVVGAPLHQIEPFRRAVRSEARRAGHRFCSRVYGGGIVSVCLAGPLSGDTGDMQRRLREAVERVAEHQRLGAPPVRRDFTWAELATP